MPPILALVIVSAFIVFCIYVEHQRNEYLSKAVWIIAIWILYSGSKGLGFYLNIEKTIEAGSLPDRNFMLLISILSIIIIIKRQFPLVTALKKNIPVDIILIYSLISLLWSRDPGISLRRWGREAVALVIALLLSSERYPIKTFTSAFKKAIYAGLPLSILLIKYYPSYGRSYGRWSGEVMWEGIGSHKNGLAMICSFSILFLIWSLAQELNDFRRLSNKIPVFIDIFMVFLALYLMMGPKRTLTYSATSFITLVLGLIILISLRITSKHAINIKQTIMLIAIIIISIGIFMPFSGKVPIKSLPILLGRTETLTERTQIWNTLIPYAKKNIFLGYGFGGFWTTSLRNRIASHAHNGYLDTILDLGIIGLLLFVSFILFLIKQSLKLIFENIDISFFFLSIIFMFIIRNIAESPFGELSNYAGWILLAWSFIMIKRDDLILGKDGEHQES